MFSTEHQHAHRAKALSHSWRNYLQSATYTVALLTSGLLSGAVVCVLLLDATVSGSGTFYTEYKQLQIRALSAPLPVLGGIATAMSGVYLSCIWRHTAARWLTSAAMTCFVVAALVTFAWHFPLNAQILSWSAQTPPTAWSEVQAQWWQAHLLRTGATVCGSTLLLLIPWVSPRFADTSA